jgi:hypothetical protein
LRLLKYRVLRAMVWPKKKEAIENRNCVFRSFMTALLSECAGDQIKMNEKCCTRGMGGRRNAYTALRGGGDLKKKRPLERPKRRWEDNIKLYLNETR